MRTADLYIATKSFFTANRKQTLPAVKNTAVIARNGFKQNPKISLIVPVYHEEKILEQTLRCYPETLREKFNIELIVSDGGSKDRTIEIARKYADVVVYHEESRKQTIAEGRNKGAEVAKGDILVFINGDTIPDEPALFFRFVREWGRGNLFKNSSALACTVDVANSDKLFKDIIFYSIHNFYIRFLNFIGVGMGRGECQIIKSEIFKAVGGYNNKIAAGEDFDLFRRIVRVSKISFTNKIKVFESPRRFRRYGYLRIIFSWIVNSLSVMISGKSVSKEWEAVR